MNTYTHTHTHTIFIYMSGIKDDSCGRRGQAAPGAQVQKHKYWRNFLALLVQKVQRLTQLAHFSESFNANHDILITLTAQWWACLISMQLNTNEIISQV
jgi:hypothetical protein